MENYLHVWIGHQPWSLERGCQGRRGSTVIHESLLASRDIHQREPDTRSCLGQLATYVTPTHPRCRVGSLPGLFDLIPGRVVEVSWLVALGDFNLPFLSEESGVIQKLMAALTIMDMTYLLRAQHRRSHTLETFVSGEM